MSRYGVNASYGHRIKKVREDEYVISWTYDRYYEGSRLRFPRGMARDTDTRGAVRFCKKHGLEIPE